MSKGLVASFYETAGRLMCEKVKNCAVLTVQRQVSVDLHIGIDNFDILPRYSSGDLTACTTISMLPDYCLWVQIL